MMRRGEWDMEIWRPEGATEKLKMRDMNLRHQFAGVENAGKVSMESRSVKKCLKVVVFVCRVIPSV